MSKLLNCDRPSPSKTYHSHAKRFQYPLTICPKRSYLSVINGEITTFVVFWIKFYSPLITYRHNFHGFISTKYTGGYAAATHYERCVPICLRSSNKEGCKFIFATVIDRRELRCKFPRVCMNEH